MLWPDGSFQMPEVKSGFGPREATIPGASTFHRGADFTGFPIVASVAAGTVVAVGTPIGWAGGGVQVWVQHDGFFTRYLHLAATYVRYGQAVGEGTPLGVMGMTGTATGVHLHLELTPGRLTFANSGQVDPVSYIKARLGGFAGGGGTPIDPGTARKFRSPAVEYIVRHPNGTVVHIVPGVKYNFPSASRYNSWRALLVNLRKNGGTNAMQIPALAEVPNVSEETFKLICDLNGVSTS